MLYICTSSVASFCRFITMCMCMFVLLFLFFFFKQKTAYEMRISDWSSDVCSSDLDRVVMRIPVRDRLAGLDRGAVLDVDGGAVGQLVALALAAVGVEHRQFARTRHRAQVATGVRDGLEVVELDRTGGLDRHAVDGRRTRPRATAVETIGSEACRE